MSSAPTSDEPLKSAPPRQGKIVTFYSYKGGTGRSMALANVAWILATNNQRVLLVDWDLEAPGLHRYLYPFLEDKQLTSSLGVINLVQEYQSTVIKDVTSTTGAQTLPAAWYEERADILRYTTELTFPFEGSGKIHFIPAGTQDASYATLVNRFNWQQLFDKLGGFHFFEAIKKQMRAEYDYVLIDSRTGVSDTSGLCTVQFPDDVVVCFTLNNQSTEGASAIASSIRAQRQPGDSPGPVQIWPLPTRIELAEKLKLDRARERARALFDPFLNNLTMRERDAYWGSVEVLYQPFFAYEEVLTAFADLPGQSHSMLSSLERLVSMFTRSSVTGMKLLAEKLRKDTLAAFSRRPGAEANRILSSLASQYEEIRRTMDAGDERTRAMTELVNRAQVSVDASESSGLAAQIFSDGSDGARIVGLALAQAFPESQHLTLALEAIQNRRSSFEQYNALVLAQSLADKLGSAERRQLAAAVQSQLGSTIDTSDLSRWNPSQDLLRKLTAADGSNNDALENRWLKFAPKPKPLEADEQWHVYISYRSANRPWVMSLYDALRQQGYQVFFDQVVLAPGTNLLHELENSLSRSQAAIWIYSPDVNDSDWNYREFATLERLTLAKGKFRFVPIRLTRSPLPVYAASRGMIDFIDYPDGPNGGQLLRLLYALNGLPLSTEAGQFITEQDELAQDAAVKIRTAIRNAHPQRLVQLFEQGGLPWQTSPVLGCQTAEGLIDLGRESDANAILERLEKQFPKTIRPKQLRALALSRSGTETGVIQAQEILGELYERGERASEILTLYAKSWLIRYSKEPISAYLRKACDLYSEAFQKAPDDYLAGIQAAKLRIALGDFHGAANQAAAVQEIVGTEPTPNDFWKSVTAAEALLILGAYPEAGAIYQAAVDEAHSAAISIQSAWDEACKLMSKLQLSEAARALIRKPFSRLPDCDGVAKISLQSRLSR